MDDEKKEYSVVRGIKIIFLVGIVFRIDSSCNQHMPCRDPQEIKRSWVFNGTSR
jgi:hypothetical protein